MNPILKPLLLCSLLAVATAASADQPLVSALALDSAQARAVTAIEAEVRRSFASIRQQHNQIMRAARRAKLAHDAVEQARLEAEASALRDRMRALRADEEARIREHLRGDQPVRYDAWLAQREAMQGSSRDATMLELP
jgi:hypothetical protein